MLRYFISNVEIFGFGVKIEDVRDTTALRVIHSYVESMNSKLGVSIFNRFRDRLKLLCERFTHKVLKLGRKP